MLPTGAAARMYCHQVGFGSEPAGLVVHVKIQPSETPFDHAGSSRMLLPGLVGEAPMWRRACHQVETAITSRTWLALEGEAGVGKLSLLRAVQVRQHPPRRSAVLDAADAATRRDWMATVRRALADADTVIVTHVDALDVRGLRGLGAALGDAKADPERSQLWVAVTRRPGSELGQLLSFFPTSVTVPPLRLRLEDLSSLVSFFLTKLGRGGHVTCSADAMRLLMRSSWPGNIHQLQQLLHEVAQQRRVGVIGADDLPPEMHSISRRVLSTLESMERDAIVRSLAATNGNKLHAARALGMSRATIYRKIHEFGIVTPN